MRSGTTLGPAIRPCPCPCREPLKPTLEEFYAFIEELPGDLDGSHFWKKGAEGLAGHYETW
ncbi:hypothetical protein [Streptomyces sp. NPDC057287]|uniref:hypothetical protein n=1 Tax=Streptomyces sp. NPDC057287 TaxID=3346086 RepID=UPI0036308DD9